MAAVFRVLLLSPKLQLCSKQPQHVFPAPKQTLAGGIVRGSLSAIQSAEYACAGAGKKKPKGIDLCFVKVFKGMLLGVIRGKIQRL